MEEAKKIVISIGQATNSWFTSILNFLKEGDLPKDRKLAKEIKTKASRYMVQNSKLYRKTTLGPRLLCIAKEWSEKISFEAH